MHPHPTPPNWPPALIAAAALLALLGCRSTPRNDPPTSPAFYTYEVQPILRSNCYRCHGSMNHHGGLRLDTPAAILAGGKSGPILVPGHPEQSLLITLIRHRNPTPHPGPMPPKGKLSDPDIATLTRWIQAGALMPEQQ